MGKTYNICLATPEDATDMEQNFFQKCMRGVQSTASKSDYDVLVCAISDGDISKLERIVKNHKVDGVILGRTLLTDDGVCLLKESGIPFVVIGSVNAEEVVQIDNNHFDACRELTLALIKKGIEKFALIGSGSNHIVNLTRYAGFEKALKESDIQIDEDLIMMDNMNCQDVEEALGKAVDLGAECIVCMDDWICNTALIKLRRDNIDVPEKIRVASFYDSQLLEGHPVSVTAIHYNPKELGSVAASTLFDMINGKQVSGKIVLGYEVLLKDSTK